MTGKEIYSASLHILAETDDNADRSDYEERYPYILALFYGEAEELDLKYRRAHKIPIEYMYFEISEIPEAEMPLCDVFASAAVYYLAAMLIIDENTEFSDRLFEKYSARMESILSGLPSELGKIKRVYF